MECVAYKRNQLFWRALGGSTRSAAVTRVCITWPVRSLYARRRNGGGLFPLLLPRTAVDNTATNARECVELDRRQ